MPADLRVRAEASSRGPRLSVVAPVRDEAPSLARLYDEVAAALEGERFELLLVDDGSRDGSAELIRALHRADPRVRGVYLASGCGQSAALAAGVHAARGSAIVTLDADLQNDPADIPELCARIGDADAAIGARRVRRDSLARRAASRVANRLRARLTGDGASDSGCALKLFRAEAIRSLPVFDGMHRFLPALLRMHGFTYVEVPVSHRPRISGASHYGFVGRALRGARDLAGVRWLQSRAIRIELAGLDAAEGGVSSLPSRPPAAHSGAGRARELQRYREREERGA